jgi:hypothetical protein
LEAKDEKIAELSTQMRRMEQEMEQVNEGISNELENYNQKFGVS